MPLPSEQFTWRMCSDEVIFPRWRCLLCMTLLLSIGCTVICVCCARLRSFLSEAGWWWWCVCCIAVAWLDVVAFASKLVCPVLESQLRVWTVAMCLESVRWCVRELSNIFLDQLTETSTTICNGVYTKMTACLYSSALCLQVSQTSDTHLYIYILFVYTEHA